MTYFLNTLIAIVALILFLALGTFINLCVGSL